jgi:hypothetical protein
MGTVEWSELLKWVPRAAQEDPAPAFQTSNQHEASGTECACAMASAAPAQAEPRVLTLASL